MNNPANQIEDFRAFAKNELKNHLHELNTKYQNQEPASIDLIQESYSKHYEIFKKELSEKMEEIITEDNRFLRPALEEIKEKYVGKLKTYPVL